MSTPIPSEMIAKWEKKVGKIDRLLADIEDLSLDDLQARLGDLGEDLEAACEWRDTCHRAVINCIDAEQPGGGLHAYDISSHRTNPALSRKLQPLNRALAEAKERETVIRRERSAVRRRIKDLKYQAEMVKIQERSDRIEAERKARQKEIDQQAVEAAAGTAATQGSRLVRLGKQLVKFEGRG